LESGALTVRATGLQGDLSLRLFMDCVDPAELAVLLQLDLLRRVLLVLHRGVVALFASLARKQYYVPHFNSRSVTFLSGERKVTKRKPD
jgi:hypothetical protein